MGKKREQDQAEGAAVSIGDEVRYIDPAGPAETAARVVGARGDVVDLVYRRDDGRLVAVEGVEHGAGRIRCWAREDEVPEPPPVPTPGGRPVMVGAAIRLHRRNVDGSHETFSLIDGNVVELIGPDEFWVHLTALAARKRLKVRDYSGGRFRANRWSWASEPIEVPPPRRYGFQHQLVPCPMTGETFVRGDGIRVVVGPPRGRREPDEFLVSPEAAELVRRLLRGEPVELPGPVEPVA